MKPMLIAGIVLGIITFSCLRADDGSTAEIAGLKRAASNFDAAFNNKDAFVWSAASRLVDGEKPPDVEMCVVRQTPEPAVKSSPTLFFS